VTPDNILYRRFSVLLPAASTGDEPALEDAEDVLAAAETTHSTVFVWLAVDLIEQDGDKTIIEQFGERMSIPPQQLSERNPAEMAGRHDPVYPAHSNSPYTTLDELAEELRAKLENDDPE